MQGKWLLTGSKAREWGQENETTAVTGDRDHSSALLSPHPARLIAFPIPARHFILCSHQVAFFGALEYGIAVDARALPMMERTGWVVHAVERLDCRRAFMFNASSGDSRFDPSYMSYMSSSRSPGSERGRTSRLRRLVLVWAFEQTNTDLLANQ
jgi:hypothetical protein